MPTWQPALFGGRAGSRKGEGDVGSTDGLLGRACKSRLRGGTEHNVLPAVRLIYGGNAFHGHLDLFLEDHLTRLDIEGADSAVARSGQPPASSSSCAAIRPGRASEACLSRSYARCMAW